MSASEVLDGDDPAALGLLSTSDLAGDDGTSAVGPSPSDDLLPDPNPGDALDSSSTPNPSLVPALTLAQLPALKPKSGGFYMLASASSKRSCVGAPKSSVMSSTKLALVKNKKLASQKWQLKSAGKGAYYLVNAKSCKALTVATPGQANGSLLVQRKLSKSNAQKWVLKGSASACYLVSKCGIDLCLTASAKKNDTMSLKLRCFEGSAAQRFTLTKTGYKLTKNALLDSLDSAKGSSGIMGFGGASFDKKSKAGKRVAKAFSAARRSSGACSFALIDLETGAGISSSANQVAYGASTIKGPYVTSICKYRAGRIDGSAKSHINSVASWSSNDDYKALRSRFGSSPMASFMSYSHVDEISPYDTWVSYSPKTLGKLWIGSYWSNFKDGNENSSYLRGQYKKGARSFIKGALNSRNSTTAYTKTGWGPFTRAGDIYNDAGIVVKDGHTYMIAVMSKAYCHPSQMRELVSALDAYEDYLRG